MPALLSQQQLADLELALDSAILQYGPEGAMLHLMRRFNVQHQSTLYE